MRNNSFQEHIGLHRLLVLSLLLLSFGILPVTDAILNSRSLNENLVIWESLEHDYPNAIFHDVMFLNASYGWVVGQSTSGASGNGIILHTTDAGETWQTQLQSPIFEDEYNQIEILDANSAWVTARGGLFHTTNGGENWTEYPIIESRLMMSMVEFIDSDHGWTATNDTLYTTVDGGETWDAIPGWNFNDTPRCMQIVSPSEIWTIGFFGIFLSTDGAETWTEVYSNGGWSLSMQNNGDGWAVSDDSIMHTSNGHDWAELTVPTRTLFGRINPPYLTDVFFVDNQGWIVGLEIPVMYTSDGGITWYEQSVPEDVSSRLMAVNFLNDTYGWAVGHSGNILKTTNGNTLGTRLWNGLTDPAIISLVVGIAVVTVLFTGGFIIYLKRRKVHLLVSNTPSIDKSSIRINHCQTDKYQTKPRT